VFLDTYIGSVSKEVQNLFVFDDDKKCMLQKDVNFCPGLLKLVDELLVNAADHQQRDPSMNTLKVDVDLESKSICVWNNGAGIPVEMHPTYNVLVPSLIFGTRRHILLHLFS
jgi:DNA topoisomerase-2